MRKYLLGLGLAALLVGLLPLSLPAQEASADSLAPTKAIEHVGEEAVVCGEVASANYANGANGQPTFLNLGRPYPNHVFTAVIWVENRSQFEKPPEDVYADRRVCVTGEIETYKGKAQIEVEKRTQIEVVKEGQAG